MYENFKVHATSSVFNYRNRRFQTRGDRFLIVTKSKLEQFAERAVQL